MSDDLEAADIWGDSSAPTDGTAANAAVAPPASNQADAMDDNDNENDDETSTMSTTDLRQRIRLLDNDIRVMKSDVQRIVHESRAQKERTKENNEKIKLNKQLPYLVGNVVEILEADAEDGELVR